jgi:DNA polymerase-1
MIYLVTKKQELFSDPDYTIINAQQALEIMQDWKIIQVDSETSGRDPHICKLLCFQFGNDNADVRIVLDCESYSITLFKDLLESKFLIGHNLKFDLQFLYNYNIIPRKVYDTMVVEQLLYLGFPYIPIHSDEYKEFNYDFPYLINDDENSKNYGMLELSFSLKALGLKYLKIDMDKTVRGEIIWRGLDKSVILYAAGDVTYLEKIMQLQKYAYRYKDCVEGVKLECSFVPAIAYLEWCGIMLDKEKWSNKMVKDNKNYKDALKALNDLVVKTPTLKKYWHVDTQGDLFLGYNTEPTVKVNWSSSSQVIPIAKILGFDTAIKDKKTGEDKDSVLEKHLATQKGINDEFLNLYFAYQEYAKVVSSFGQGHLDAVNPKTGRIHTTFKQLGAASGRMSCGSKQNNEDLEKFKKLPKGSCKYPNIQQLPADEDTRSSFISPEGNLMVSADFSA